MKDADGQILGTMKLLGKGWGMYAIPPALTTDLARLEKELAEVRAKLTAKTPPRIPVQIRDTRRFVERELSNLRILFNEEPPVVGAEISRHIERITLTSDGKTCIASGIWDLLGFSRGCNDGAGG